MASKKSARKKIQSKAVKCCCRSKAGLIILIALIAVAALVLLCMINEITGQAIATCTDSDNGKNYFVAGTTKSGTAAFTDYCSGNTLYEGYCSRNKIARITYTCGAGYQCISGACKIPPSPTPAPSPAACTDSDGGQELYTKGTAADSLRSYTDFCGAGNLTGVLYEGYCYNNTAYQMSFRCQYGCTNGKCICTAGQACVTP